MPLLHLRITGTEDDVRLLTDLLNDVDGIERIEEIADLMPHMDDEDSSSAGLSDDIGPGTHELEVEVPHAAMLDKLRDIIEAGIACGDFDVADSLATTNAMLSMGIDVARWYRDGGSLSPDEMGGFYAELATRMVGWRPPVGG